MIRVFKEIEDVVLEKNHSIQKKLFKATDLPSEGRFYPKNLTIKYRLYTFGELKTITPLNLSEDEPELVKDYFDLCLNGFSFNMDFPKYELGYYDFIYLSLMRKFPSIVKNPEDPFEITARCPNCETLNLFELELENIEFKTLPKESDLTIAIDKEIFSFKPITIARYLETLEFKKSEQNINNDILFLAASFDTGKSLKENYDILFNLEDREAIAKLSKIETLLPLNIEPYNLECEHCKNSFSINLATNKIEYGLSFPIIVEEDKKTQYYKNLIALAKRVCQESNISFLDVQYLSLNDILLLLEKDKE